MRTSLLAGAMIVPKQLGAHHGQRRQVSQGFHILSADQLSFPDSRL